MQLQSIAHGVVSLYHSTPGYGKALRQMKVVKFRGSDFHSGLQDFAIRAGGIVVFPRLTAQEHVVEFRRESLPSGVAALDALLGGGIDRGTSTLLVGPAGTGKSTVALQFATAAAARGDHAAVFAFEESRAILLERAASLGMSLVEGTGPGQIFVRQIDPAEIAPGEFAHAVRPRRWLFFASRGFTTTTGATFRLRAWRNASSKATLRRRCAKWSTVFRATSRWIAKTP